MRVIRAMPIAAALGVVLAVVGSKRAFVEATENSAGAAVGRVRANHVEAVAAEAILGDDDPWQRLEIQTDKKDGPEPPNITGVMGNKAKATRGRYDDNEEHVDGGGQERGGVRAVAGRGKDVDGRVGDDESCASDGDEGGGSCRLASADSSHYSYKVCIMSSSVCSRV